MKKQFLNFGIIVLAAGIICSCAGGKAEKPEIQVSTSAESSKKIELNGIPSNLPTVETRPGSVLMTGVAEVRLIPIYRINRDSKGKNPWIGSNQFIYSSRYDDDGVYAASIYSSRYDDGLYAASMWNNHIIPGVEIVHGYNMVNVTLFDTGGGKRKDFFAQPALIENVYYPAFTRDTLCGKPVKRDFFVVTAYDADTNRDNVINAHDLRRMYLFNLQGERMAAAVPENYSVFQTEYDPANDWMIVFAQLDGDANGRRDDAEPVHVFWIDMKNARSAGRMY